MDAKINKKFYQREFEKIINCFVKNKENFIYCKANMFPSRVLKEAISIYENMVSQKIILDFFLQDFENIYDKVKKDFVGDSIEKDSYEEIQRQNLLLIFIEIKTLINRDRTFESGK